MIHQEHRYECEGTHEKYCLKCFVKVLSYVLPTLKVTADIILPADLKGAVRIRYLNTRPGFITYRYFVITGNYEIVFFISIINLHVET